MTTSTRTVGLLTVILLAALAGATGTRAAAAAACAKTPMVRSLVLISARTGAINRSFADVGDGGVSAVLADGRGGWFVSGGFACVGKAAVPGLVHLHGDGTLDATWHAVLPQDRQYINGHPPAVALALFGKTLYAGGPFGVEALNASTGARLWLTTVNGRQGVFAAAVNAQAVYAGGDFNKVGGEPRPSLAALDPRTGHPLAWHAPAFGGNHGSLLVNPVLALALTDSRLFVGGSFVSVGGQKRPQIAALDARSGRLTPWVPGPAKGYVRGAGVGDVDTIFIADDRVFTSGHDGFGVTDARTGKVEAWMYDVHGVGFRFAAFGNTAYLGGGGRNGFDAVNGKSRNNLAAINLATGTFTSWAPNIDRYVGVAAIAASRDQVLVGGGFYKKNG